MIPTELVLRNAGRELVLRYAQEEFVLSAEYLRVCSPSVEVRGDGKNWQIVAGKRAVYIAKLLPVGQYGVRPAFSDGHIAGIYSWAILRDLALNYASYWQTYLEALAEQGRFRESRFDRSGV